ncbi:MAG: hypothetical protein AB8B64_16685 [Granulosicoccus sp.]
MAIQVTFRSYEKGSALVEFSFLLGVLLPLGFGVSMIGKLTDLKQTTEQASRYAAWEATVYSRQQLLARPSAVLEARFFEAPDARLSSTEVQGNAARVENPLWGASAQTTDGLRELGHVSRKAAREVSSNYAFDTGKAKAMLITGKVAAAAGKPLSGFKGNSWGIVADGLLRSNVDVALQPSELLPGSGTRCGTADFASESSPDNKSDSVCVRAAAVILADGWAASGDAQTVSRVRSLVPASTMQRVGEGVGKLLGSVIFPELDPLDKAFGHIDMRVLPTSARP